MKTALAAELYREGKITLKRAADTAEFIVWDIRCELGKRKISYANITLEYLYSEIETY